MSIFLGMIGGLIFVIFFVSLSAYWLYKGHKEQRRIMDRFYMFATIAAVDVKSGKMSKEEEQALILDMKEAIVGGSVLKRLRALDAVMDRYSVNFPSIVYPYGGKT